MRLRITDSNMYPIPGNNHMLHLATISSGLREFWVMLCIKGPQKDKCYIEEYVPTMVSYSEDIFGHFKFIEEDELAEELTRFAESKKLTDIPSRLQEARDLGKAHLFLG